MNTYTYPHAAAMAGAVPHLAYLLRNTAVQIGDMMQAINNNRIYTWPAL